MVPWQLQPQYRASGSLGAEHECRAESKAARAKVRKQRRRERSKEKQDPELGGVPCSEKCEGLEETGVRKGGVCCPTEAREESDGTPTAAELRGCGGFTTYQRYYHVFKQGELRELCSKVPTLSIQQEFYDHENWCILATKSP